jgi:hypothetical protein
MTDQPTERIDEATAILVKQLTAVVEDLETRMQALEADRAEERRREVTPGLFPSLLH